VSAGHRHFTAAVLTALTLCWDIDGQAEPASPESAPQPALELPHALFILPWQPQGRIPEARKRWLDKLPPGHIQPVDEHALTRQVDYHAILSRSAPVPATDRDQDAQEE